MDSEDKAVLIGFLMLLIFAVSGITALTIGDVVDEQFDNKQYSKCIDAGNSAAKCKSLL